MIQKIEYGQNEKVASEIAAIEKERPHLEERVASARTLADYIGPYLDSCDGAELKSKLPGLKKMKVLDIGFGRGETSLYLALQGHEVHAIEPSPLQCEILQAAAGKYGQKITVYEGTMESFEKLDEEGFDLCLFHSSLHHCDDPLKALSICRVKLKVGGTVLVLNEPILKFYRSKESFYRQMEEDPVSVGHYGGNEHIYYHHEYIELLEKAGFKEIASQLHVKNKSPREVIKSDLFRMIDGQYVLSDRKLFLKFTILMALKNIWCKPLVALGKKLSLFPYSFSGKKG